MPKKSKIKKVVEEEVTISFKEPLPIHEENLVPCPKCGFKRGLSDEKTLCENCKGSGMVPAVPLE